MKMVSVDLPANHTIALAGDWHVGARACSHRAIQATVDWVKAKRNRYFAGMGDWAEAIHINDRRFDMRGHTFPHSSRPIKTPLKQYQVVEDYLAQIKKRVLAVLAGNHDKKLEAHGEFTEFMADRLDAAYLDYAGKLDVRVGGDTAYRILLWHGWGVARSRAKDRTQRIANERASVKRKLDQFEQIDCEVQSMGHLHALKAFRVPKQVHVYHDNEGRLQSTTEEPQVVTRADGYRHVPEERRIYCVTGTTLRTFGDGYSTYAEQRGYSPAPLGFIAVSYNNGRLSVEPVQVDEDSVTGEVMDLEREVQPTYLEAVRADLGARNPFAGEEE